MRAPDLYICRAVYRSAQASSETGDRGEDASMNDPLADKHRDTPTPSFIVRLLGTFLRTLANRPKDNYNTVFRSNAPFSFTATPFSVTIAVMSSAGVTSKLGL